MSSVGGVDSRKEKAILIFCEFLADTGEGLGKLETQL